MRARVGPFQTGGLRLARRLRAPFAAVDPEIEERLAREVLRVFVIRKERVADGCKSRCRPRFSLTFSTQKATLKWIWNASSSW